MTDKIDVYSLGCIMYECLTATVPFEHLGRSENNMGLFQIILAVAIKGLRPALPEDMHIGIRTLILDCWHSDPRRRPASKEVLRM